ncbi:SRPBCC domain-containing protein [Nocardioides gilvus]|uniref:SRPBCC domain-containing protein n=1 Tax=Nocardioides gilvus TaxID=1735589 RepID=UPI000D74D429|nr:SRPBCC domain-containing protein [Nocardioides gilvus]
MSTTALPHHPQAEITADPDVPAIRIERDFNATAAQLSRAHLDPEIFVQWCGPDSVTVRVVEWDARPLGSYRYLCVEKGGEGGGEHAFRGTFPHVSENRIVQTFCYEPFPESISLETMTFTDLGGGRTRLHAFSLCDSFEARDQMLASGMDTGVNEGYLKLDTLLARGAL